MDENSAHETSPLLTTAESDSLPQRKPTASWYQLQQPHHIALLICLSVFCWVLSGTMAIVPVSRVAEDVFCHRYYHREDDDIDESLCKVPEVQSSMAYLFAFVFMLNGVLGLLVAFPFGVLADRARKPVYVLGTLGHSLNVAWSLLVFYMWRTLPIELVLLAPAFQLLGGGIMIVIAVLYSMLSDVVVAENRTTWFFFCSLSAQTAGFIGIPVSAKMMELWSPWAPLSITLILGPLNGLIMIFMPETISLPEKPNREDDMLPAEDIGWRVSMRTQFRDLVLNARGSLAILRNRTVALILLCFVLIAQTSSGLFGIFIQYFSMRFHRTLAEAGYVLTLRGGLATLVMGVILPVLTRIMSHPRMHLSAYRRDLILARGSAAALCVGFMLISGPDMGFLVAGLIIVTLSSGLGPVCRSLITNYVEPGQTSRLFTLVGILEMIGTLPCGPLLAWAFSCGMRLKGFWYGLPFLILAFFALGTFTALFFLDTPKASEVTVLVPDDEESQSEVADISPSSGSSETS